MTIVTKYNKGDCVLYKSGKYYITQVICNYTTELIIRYALSSSNTTIVVNEKNIIKLLK